MTRINDRDVAYVADLAHLELTDQERRRMLKDLNSILDYIERLNELDTTNVPPMAQISGSVDNIGVHDAVANRLREDVLTPCLSHAEAMKNAPATDGEFFKVPKVIEK